MALLQSVVSQSLQLTCVADRKWGQAYLTREFFHQLGETMPEHVMLVVAREAASNDIAAGALNLIGSEVGCATRPLNAGRNARFSHCMRCSNGVTAARCRYCS